MMGEEAPETCWVTHKRQVINLWNCCILLVNLFETYDNARTYKHHISKIVLCFTKCYYFTFRFADLLLFNSLCVRKHFFHHLSLMLRTLIIPFSGFLLLFISPIFKQNWRHTWPQKCLPNTLHVLLFALLLGSMRALRISLHLDEIISRLTTQPNVVIVLCTLQ